MALMAHEVPGGVSPESYLMDLSQELADSGNEALSVYTRRLGRTAKHSTTRCSLDQAIALATPQFDSLDDFGYSLPRLKELIEQYPESVTAKSLCESAVFAALAEHAFVALGDAEGAASAWVKAFREHGEVVKFSEELILAVPKAMEKIYCNTKKEPRIRANALLVCAYIGAASADFEKALGLLRLAEHLLPKDPHVPEVAGHILGTLQMKGDALKAYSNAFKLGCGNIDSTLFLPAVLLMDAKDEEYQNLGVTMLENFVSKAEPDARKLPAACYRLALIYGTRGLEHVGAAKRFYLLAETADEARLPVYRDEVSDLRLQARKLLKHYVSCGNEECSGAANLQCAFCLKAHYCCRECQEKDWPCHKAVCKKHRKKKKSGKRK